MNIEELEDCIITFDQCLAELEKIEAKLAIYFDIDGYIEDIDYHGTIRENLIYILHNKEETELVKDWQENFSSYYSFLQDDFPEKYIELKVFMALCSYKHDCGGKSVVDKNNFYYKHILNRGRWNIIIPLLKYISFNWVVFSLISDISNKNIWLDFPQKYAGMLDKVEEYFLNWGKKEGYIK